MSVCYCGREFSEDELTRVRCLIADNPDSSRARTLAPDLPPVGLAQTRRRTQTDVRSGRDAAHAGRWADHLTRAAG